MLHIILSILVGLIVGSFLNVVIHRLPLGRSIVRPRSSCPGCGHALGVRDLVPILSFFLLRGRCRYCRRPISWRYPLVEAIAGAVFGLLALRYGASLDALFLAIYAALLIAVAGIDLGHMLVPDVLSLPGIGLGLFWGLLRGAIGDSLLGAAVGGGFLLAVYLAALVLLRKEGLGLGDIKLMTMVGAFLCWQGAVFAVFIGSVLGAIAGVIMMAAGRLRRGQPMPFGPYLAGAGLLLAVWPWWLWWELWMGLIGMPVG